LASAYRKYNKKKEVLWLLATLSVREISEADYKYSAVISCFFPLNILNLLLGSIILASKNKVLNFYVLQLYFLPVALITLALFIAWQIVILPFCYFKLVIQKLALVYYAPKGERSISRTGRFL